MPEYVLFAPPEPFDFLDFEAYRGWSPAKAREYLRWFVRAIPERIEQLRGLWASSGNPPDALDKSLASLVALDPWAREQVQTRPRTEEEVRVLRERHPPSVLMFCPPWEFTDYTRSVIVDLGIYLGECVRIACPAAGWIVNTTAKTSVDYAQPVLGSIFGGVLNPFRRVDVVCRIIAEGGPSRADLAELYEIGLEQMSA